MTRLENRNMVAPMAALLALASLLALLSGSAAAAPPLLIRVDPRAPPSPATPALGAQGAVRSATTTLGGAASTLAAALAEGSRDVAIELSPGAHRVPEGGLHLTPAHTPASAAHSVSWRCASGGCSVHGGTPVSGWAPCKPGACVNGSTMVAPVPATLKGAPPPSLLPPYPRLAPFRHPTHASLPDKKRARLRLIRQDAAPPVRERPPRLPHPRQPRRPLRQPSPLRTPPQPLASGLRRF